MPLDNASSDLVRPRREVQRAGYIPPDPINLAVEWKPGVGDSGVVEDRLVISWQHNEDEETAGLVRLFVVHWQDAEDTELWNGPFYSYRPFLELCCCLGPRRGIRVAVSSMGMDGAYRAPGTTTAVAEVVLEPGLDLVPAKVTGLAATQIDDRYHITWDRSAFPGNVVYELRHGDVQWETAAPLGETTANYFDWSQHPTSPTVVLVAAKNARGNFSSPAALEVTLLLPWDSSVVFEQNLDDFSGGTHDGTEFADGTLHLQDGETEGEWLSDAEDQGVAGPVGRYGVGFAKVLAKNLGLTWGWADFSWQSGEARRRSWLWGAQQPEWYPERFERRGILTWADATFTWDSAQGKGYTWAHTRKIQAAPKDPTFLAWSEAKFAWNSPAGKSTSWGGFLSSAETACQVYVRFSPDGSAWGAWQPIGVASASNRWVQFRVVFTQPVAAIRLEVSAVNWASVNSREDQPVTRQVPLHEVPTGTINGSNDTFTISQTPVHEGRVLVISDGVVLRPVVDYTFGGTGNKTLTYNGGTQPATWHLVAYYYEDTL